jgi:hypothetical protein
VGKLSLALKFEGPGHENAMAKLVNNPVFSKPGPIRVSYASVNRDTKKALVTVSADLTEVQERLILKVLGLG